MSDAEMLAGFYEQIKATNVALGWDGPGAPPVGVHEAVMLLVTEVAEAAEAWRAHGFMDMTPAQGEPVVTGAQPGESPGLRVRGHQLPKPQGVGSELADAAIRYLDDCGRFGWPLPVQAALGDRPAVQVAPPLVQKMQRLLTSDSFFTGCGALSWFAIQVSEEHEAGYGVIPSSVPQQFWHALLVICAVWGIDLEAEVKRKMAYNKTRTWRHGGKRL